MKETYNCRKCGDEVGFTPEDYEDGKHPNEICGYCNGGISLWNAIRDSFGWGGILGMIKMFYFRWKN